MNKLLLTLAFLLSWVSSWAVTATFTPDPATPLTELPEYIYFSLDESGQPPLYSVSSGSASVTGQMPQYNTPTSYKIPLQTLVKGDLLEQVNTTGKFTIELSLNYGSGPVLPAVTYTIGNGGGSEQTPLTVTSIDPSNANELDEIPSFFNFSLSETLSAVPSLTLASGDVTLENLTCYRNGSSAYIAYGLSAVTADFIAAVGETGEFTFTIVTAEGRKSEPLTYRVKMAEEALTATWDPADGTELDPDALPASVNFSLSKVMNGQLPKAVIKAGTESKSSNVVSTPDGTKYKDYMVYVQYYLKDALLEAAKAAGEFTIEVTLFDGTVLTTTYKLKTPVTATWDPADGTELDPDALPASVNFSLSKVMNGQLPKAVIKAGTESKSSNVASTPNGTKYKDYMVYVQYYLKDALLEAAKAAGEFTIEVTLFDGTVLTTTYKVQKAVNATWTPEPGTEFELDAIPATVNFSLSEEKIADNPTAVIKAGDVEVKTRAAQAEGGKRYLDFRVWVGAYMKDALLEAAKAAGEFTVEVTWSDGLTFSSTYRLKAPERPQGPVTLGYTVGDIDAPGNFIGENNGTTVGAAIYIPATRMTTMRGGKLTSMRFATAAGLERVYAWIRTSLDEPAVILESVGNSADGWNEVTFTTPYEITGDAIYIGYSGYQTAGVKAIRTETTSAVNPNACWLSTRDRWQDMHQAGYGNLMIEAKGEAPLALNDLMFTTANIDNRYFGPGTEPKLSLTVSNAGLNEAAGFTISYSIDGGEPVVTTYDETIANEASVTKDLTVNVAGLADGMHRLSVDCGFAAEGVSDENTANNTRNFDFGIYSKSFDRTMLLEEFSTIGCVNCPAGRACLEKATEGRTDIVTMVHHVGFGTDEFTIQESNEMLVFDVPGAPSLMVDRTLIPMMNVSTPPFGIGYRNTEEGAEKITEALDYAASIPTFAEVAVSNTYDPETRDLVVTVSGSRLPLLTDMVPEAMLTVCLTESDIQSKRVQSGADDSYRHNHVARAYLTPAFGNAIEWTDDNFEVTYTTTLTEGWKANNMQVVAFVNKPRLASDVNGMQVLNASASDIVDPTVSSIGSVAADGSLAVVVRGGSIEVEGADEGSIRVTDTMGREVSNSNIATGLYIVSGTIDGNAFTVKTFVKQ